jgi:hypothetical protein
MPACADPARLVAGVTRSVEIKTGEVHLYKVDLSAGDFLRVAVDQQGIDVAVELLGPDDRPVALVDGPGPVPEYGTEDLAAIPGSSGLYTIRVRGGVRNEPRARYRIRMQSPRPAQADDRRRVEAVRANQEATNVMGRAGDTRRQQAALRQKALRLWHDLGETAREADTLVQLGTLHTSLGQAEQAAPSIRTACSANKPATRTSRWRNTRRRSTWPAGWEPASRRSTPSPMSPACSTGEAGGGKR